MKILKYIVLGLFILFVLFFIVSILLPSYYKVERSRIMNFPASVIFEEVNSFKKWKNWSPWIEKDSTIVNTFEGPESGAGSKMSWTSKKSGEGEMSITASYPSDSIVTSLTLKDFGMTSTGKFNFEKDSISNETKVTWSMEGNLGFFSRVWGLMMDGMMGKDFDRGLENIEKYLKTKPVVPEMKIEMVNVNEMHIMSVKQTCTPAEIGSVLGKLYQEIFIQMQIQNLQTTGQPMAIYHSYSSEKVELEAAISVNKAGKSNDRVLAGVIKSGNAVRADYLGSYDNLKIAYDAIDKWISSNNKKVTGSPWELYVTDPTTVSDPSQILTQIYFPVE